MRYPTTDVTWIDADHELPSKDVYGPYPRVIVATQYVDHPEYGFGQQIAELRFLGKRLTRPVWLDPKTHAPIETEAICVRYWTNPLTDPEKQA